MSPSIPPTPADLERLAGLLRHDLTGAEIAVVPSAYSAEPRGAVRVRLGHRAFVDLADDGASWFVAGLWADQGGETPPGERRREFLAVPLQAEAPVVATAVVASVWRWVEAIGAQEADAAFTRTSRSAPPAIPGPAVFGAPAPAPYATSTAPYATSQAPASAAAPRRRRSKGLLVGGLVAAGLLVLTGGTVAAVAVAHTATELASASSTGAGTDDSGTDGSSGADGEPGGGAPHVQTPGMSDDLPDTYPGDLVAGDCFGLGLGNEEGQGTIGGVDLQPCDGEHEFETYAVVDAPDGDWPGDEAVAAFAEGACATEFESFVGVPWESSVVRFAYLQPTSDGWYEGDHGVLCYAYIEGDTSPGTLEGYGY